MNNNNTMNTTLDKHNNGDILLSRTPDKVWVIIIFYATVITLVHNGLLPCVFRLFQRNSFYGWPSIREIKVTSSNQRSCVFEKMVS